MHEAGTIASRLIAIEVHQINSKAKAQESSYTKSLVHFNL